LVKATDSEHLTLLLAFAFVFLLAVPALAAPKVVLDNQEVSFETPPLIEQGRLLVPLRSFSEKWKPWILPTPALRRPLITGLKRIPVESEKHKTLLM